MVDYAGSQISLYWQNRIGIVPSSYRLVTFLLAVVHLLILHPDHPTPISPVNLLIAAGIYSVFKVLPIFNRNARTIGNILLFSIDIAVCTYLLISTGGLGSPFLLYSLSPLLTSALFLSLWTTLIIIAPLLGSVIIHYLTNPDSSTADLYGLPVYITSACLIAVLPYLINVNLRQYIEAQDILRERHRLAQEIHDTISQTISVLRWQIQQLNQRLTQNGADFSEVRELEHLAEKAYGESRESLELLRCHTGNSDFVLCLESYLERLKNDAGINSTLKVETKTPHLQAVAELQLTRICQEALCNIRKHSGARNVDVKVTSVNHHLEVSIIDDGCGFENLSYCSGNTRCPSHGLDIMQERAKSIGGKLRILSTPGEGTEIHVGVPVNARRGRLPWVSL